MPDWKQVQDKIALSPNPFDQLRRNYLGIMHQYTGRNVIAYYSSFLQKPAIDGASIDDNDMNAFMQTVHCLDKSKGLDLLLHTPGGELHAAVSLIEYLHAIFGNNIRAFVPQLAMSAGTMIALSCQEIVMGKQSAIGPIDPQFGGVSCSGVIEEFRKACEEASLSQGALEMWKPIIGKYHPTFLGDCDNAIKWAGEVTTHWLEESMFANDNDSTQKANRIVSILLNHQETYFHGRHYHINECKNLGIKVIELESLDSKQIDDCQDLQDCVLTIHHAYMQTLGSTNAIKIVENHNGNAMVISHQG